MIAFDVDDIHPRSEIPGPRYFLLDIPAVVDKDNPAVTDYPDQLPAGLIERTLFDLGNASRRFIRQELGSRQEIRAGRNTHSVE
jgi:hypothetical protein